MKVIIHFTGWYVLDPIVGITHATVEAETASAPCNDSRLFSPD